MARAFVAASSHWIHWGDPWSEELSDFSLSVWARPVADTVGYVIAKWITSAGMFVRASGVTPTTLQFGVNGAGDASQVQDATSFFANNTWVHIGITFLEAGDNASDVTIYQNGTQVAFNGGMDRILANSANFGIGNRSDLARDWDGDIAEPAYWFDQLLTADQMRALGQGYRADQIGTRPTFYAPCLDAPTDIIGALAVTDNGTTKADHSFIRPARRHFTFWSKGTAVPPPPPPTVAHPFAGTRRIHRLAPVRWG